MNHKILSLILWFLGSFGIISTSYASSTYTPGAIIALTGSTEDIRFDVAGVIFDSGTTAGNPELVTASKNFEGSFYMTGIGWGLFQTGVYQVGLDCGTMSLSSLTGSCRLTGSGWAETIGELGFSGVEYIPSQGVLSGTLWTFFGNMSLSGIYLPLKPANFTSMVDGSLAYHSLSLTVSGGPSYGENTLGWSLKLEPQSAIEPRTYAGDAVGRFTLVDLSLADTYRMTITDPHGSTTEQLIRIFPGNLSLTLASGPYFLSEFCTNHPTVCPDGATLRATELSKTGDNLVGDGESYYHFRLRSRDQYGNIINTGSIDIVYTTSIKTVQVEDDATTLLPVSFIGSLEGSAVIHSGGVLVNHLDGTSRGSSIDMLGQDVRYSIASIAPSDAVNVVQLQSITYTTGTGQIMAIPGLDTDPLVFRPWFESSTSTSTPIIQVGEDHGFSVSVTDNSSRTDTTPYISTFLTVGDGAFGAFRDFTSTGTIECQAYPQDLGSYTSYCDWSLLAGFTNPSIIRTESATSFSLTGTYAPMTRYPVKENVRSQNMIHYTGIDTLGLPADILYHGTSTNYGNSFYRDSRVRILGTNNAQGEYGDFSLGGNGKAKFLDGIRKKIALLSRNRTDYNDVDYTVIIGNYTLTGGSFDTKKSIIVIGGDITLSENITAKDWPIAIIALSDALGNGGVITIDPSVTDITAALITDRHILSSGDKQLYIRGSLISSNTLGDTAARICPYYVSAACDTTEAALYDLEKMREGFTELSDTTGKTALAPRAVDYPDTALIIEQDIRIVTNPPPGL